MTYIEEAAGRQVRQVDSTQLGPDFSVVVPTFNRRNSICDVLESLTRQTLPRERFEVIVVSDGSTDGTIDAAKVFKERFSNLQILDLPNRGPAGARNVGARAARGKYLAFTDDDCLADENWLEQLLFAFERTGAVGVQGQTTTDHNARSPLTHQIEIVRAWTSSMSTCNAAYLKAVFDAVKGFDESFKFAHNEDRDLAWRAEELGPLVFAPEARIIHPPRRGYFLATARRVRIFETDFLLYHKNSVKYRKYISRSPWRTIYYQVAVVQQLNELKANFRYLLKSFKPQHFFVGVALIAARWFYLIRFFPAYLKAEKSHRGNGSGSDETSAFSAEQAASGDHHELLPGG